MKAFGNFLKSIAGLIYTSIVLFLLEFGIVYGAALILRINWSWIGAILFWMFAMPVIIWLFQTLASVIAIPCAALMKRTKYLSLLILIPTIYFLFSFGKIMWLTASGIGGVLIWLICISVFLEFAWLFCVYAYVSIGSAFE